MSAADVPTVEGGYVPTVVAMLEQWREILAKSVERDEAQAEQLSSSIESVHERLAVQEHQLRSIDRVIELLEPGDVEPASLRPS